MTTAGRSPVQAAVLRHPGALDLEEVWIDEPEPNEVRVRPHHVGICHSDLHYVDGTHTTTLPEVLGHEAAGVVESVGAAVTDLRPGDRVVTSLTMYCGTCRFCVSGRMSLCAERPGLRRRTRASLVDGAGAAVGTMGGIGAFAGLLNVHRNGVARVPDQLPLHLASLFGCAVLTGVGAVTRAARVAPGDTVLVVGCGGIGLSAIQGARIAGASRIIALDRAADKLAAALRFGATDTVPAGADAVAHLRALTEGGVDHAFEAVGRRATVDLALQALAPGGTCTVLGMVPDETPIEVRPSDLYFHEKKLQGAFIGSSRFPVDVPWLARLYDDGRLLLDELITHQLPFAEIRRGIDLLAGGSALRVVLDLPSAEHDTTTPRNGATPVGQIGETT